MQSVSFNENKVLPLPRWMWSSVINLSPDNCLVPLESGDKSEAQCWSVLLARWSLSSGYSHSE